MADKNFILPGSGRALSENTQSNSSSSKSDKSSLQSESHMNLLMRLQAGEKLDEEQRKIAERLREAMNKNMANINPSPEKSSILYTCELFGEDEALPKSEMLDAIGACLFKKLENCEEDLLYTATSIIHTLNKEDIKIPAMDTIKRYLQNIISNPTEQKFKRIKLSNKVYQEKVGPCKGAVEFLIATGFRKGLSDSEEFLVMDNTDVERIKQALNVLFDGKPIDIKLFRDRKVMQICDEEQENIHYSPHSSDISNFFRGSRDSRISEANCLNNKSFQRREHNFTTQIKDKEFTAKNIYIHNMNVYNNNIKVYTQSEKKTNSFSSSFSSSNHSTLSFYNDNRLNDQLQNELKQKDLEIKKLKELLRKQQKKSDDVFGPSTSDGSTFNKESEFMKRTRCCFSSHMLFENNFNSNASNTSLVSILKKNKNCLRNHLRKIRA
ncbi:UBX domain-containing protein [Meloidogyne graminicola]|uniref:UBX domain-containing protein n=1 Tax=Meloidogyne graminicola TaxID=189291 RepID=A0A8S9ZNH5_9BILA|nr:UBX domain-containing protein [Meloidogyne graminicola]